MLFFKVFKILFPHYCLGQGLLDMSFLYNTAEVKHSLGGYSSRDNDYDPLDFDLVGINLVCMVVQGLVYFALNLLIQYRFFIYSWPAPTGITEPETSKSSKFQDEYVKIVNLTKIYRRGIISRKTTPAVKSLSIDLVRGECLGLFGKNGAGKSTTFKMIIGEVPISEGDVLVNGKSIRADPYQVYKDLGYCPQSDALFPLLTVREHLYFYGMLRGIPETHLKSIGDRMLQRFELESMANRISKGNYFYFKIFIIISMKKMLFVIDRGNLRGF